MYVVEKGSLEASISFSLCPLGSRIRKDIFGIFKVVRMDVSGKIPPKFEYYLRRH